MRNLEPMRKIVRSETAKRLKKLAAELRHVAHEPKEAAAIHDLRVSIRRLSRELRVFEAWFGAKRVKSIRRRLRKLMDHCAAVRNCDVAIEVLQEAGVQNADLVAGLEKEGRRTRAELARKLASWRRVHRVRKWRGQLRAAELPTTFEESARSLLLPLMENLFRAGQEAARPGSSHREMHQFRLKAKRIRYTLELFEPVYGAKSAKITESLKGLQSKLGAINDCAATLQMIRLDRAAADGVRRLASEREAEFRSYWKKHFGPREKTQWKAVLSAADGNK